MRLMIPGTGRVYVQRKNNAKNYFQPSLAVLLRPIIQAFLTSNVAPALLPPSSSSLFLFLCLSIYLRLCFSLRVGSLLPLFLFLFSLYLPNPILVAKSNETTPTRTHVHVGSKRVMGAFYHHPVYPGSKKNTQQMRAR